MRDAILFFGGFAVISLLLIGAVVWAVNYAALPGQLADIEQLRADAATAPRAAVPGAPGAAARGPVRHSRP